MRRYVEITVKVLIDADTKNGIRTAMREGRKHGFFPLFCAGPGYSWTPKSFSVKALPSKRKAK